MHDLKENIGFLPCGKGSQVSYRKRTDIWVLRNYSLWGRMQTK